MRKRVPTADFDLDTPAKILTSSAQASVETLNQANTSSASFRSRGECSDGNFQENLLGLVEGRNT